MSSGVAIPSLSLSMMFLKKKGTCTLSSCWRLGGERVSPAVRPPLKGFYSSTRAESSTHLASDEQRKGEDDPLLGAPVVAGPDVLDELLDDAPVRQPLLLVAPLARGVQAQRVLARAQLRVLLLLLRLLGRQQRAPAGTCACTSRCWSGGSVRCSDSRAVRAGCRRLAGGCWRPAAGPAFHVVRIVPLRHVPVRPGAPRLYRGQRVLLLCGMYHRSSCHPSEAEARRAAARARAGASGRRSSSEAASAEREVSPRAGTRHALLPCRSARSAAAVNGAELRPEQQCADHLRGRQAGPHSRLGGSQRRAKERECSNSAGVAEEAAGMTVLEGRLDDSRD